MKALEQYDRYFLSYSGVKLPFKLVNELARDEIENRNTYFATILDPSGRTSLMHKIVYGDVELEHLYQYDASGQLARVEITNVDGERQCIDFAS